LMAEELPRVGGVFVQAEDELAAINMVIGASWAGLKAMTATSGPGFSLMQEGIGYAVMTETPLVLVDVMRAGPATGQATKAAQGDLMQARWGRHGDQFLIVLAPMSPQEAYSLIIEAFNISEMLRVPVVFLMDEFIGHGREVVYRHGAGRIVERRRPSNHEPPFGSNEPSIPPPMPRLGEGYYVLVTGSTHDEWGYRDVHSYETHYKLVARLKEKIWRNLDKIFMYEVVGDPGKAEKAVVCFGSTCRSAKQAIKGLDKVVLIRLVTVWPINYELLGKLLANVDRVVVPELSLGQLIYDVKQVVDTDVEVIGVNKVGGGIPIYPSEIREALG
ncbi:MAG TPA: 2-oxoacid:acceptor oxidoreductase subunit alpha, partial [Chromatiaceae bacterium]|nr:2-oxoacid:acceptor oxidoreductase subunit alpha [Chromatiaceae bacterium]